MAIINFNVLEKADATGMLIYKTSGENITLGAVLTTTLPDGTEKEYIFTADDITDFNEGLIGADLTASLVTDGDMAIFEDGIYKFEIGYDPVGDSGEHTEGFCALVTSNVIKEALGYRFYENRATKEYIQEKMRLLNNLAYAASVRAEESFNNNLEILERMQ